MRLCREIKNPPTSKITELLNNNPDVIQAGLTFIDHDVVIPHVGEIDMVAAAPGQLNLICTFGYLTSEHMGRAAGIKRWAQENLGVLLHEYTPKGLTTKFEVRIIFLCSGMDTYAHSLLSVLNSLPLDVLRYRCLEYDGNVWLAVEKIETMESQYHYDVGLPRRACDDDTPRINLDRFRPAELTSEELGEFFIKEKPPRPVKTEAACLSIAPPEEELDFFGPYFTQAS